MAETLKPCPFCGGEAWLNDYEAKFSDLPPMSRCPQCRSCGSSLGYLPTKAKAIAAWNRRTAPVPASQVGTKAEGRSAPNPPTTGGEVERLRAALTRIAKMKPTPIGDTGFQTGPLALFNAAKSTAQDALRSERKVRRAALEASQ